MNRYLGYLLLAALAIAAVPFFPSALFYFGFAVAAAGAWLGLWPPPEMR